MATTTVPRPPMNPPTGPLPALPVPKTRTPIRSGLASPERRTSTAISRPPPSPSTLPMRPQSKHANSTSTIPQQHGPPQTPQPGKTLRKTISIGAFPQPPKTNRASHPTSPLSSATTLDGITTDRRGSAGSLNVPASALRKRPSIQGRGGPSGIKSPLMSPSALTEVSPTPSRSSSANGSYSTGVEDMGGAGEDDGGRGRELSKTTSADKDASSQKGNVIVSVRVRPNASNSENSGLQDWELDNRAGVITYRGKEGGDFQSGTCVRF